MARSLRFNWLQIQPEKLSNWKNSLSNFRVEYANCRINWDYCVKLIDLLWFFGFDQANSTVQIKCQTKYIYRLNVTNFNIVINLWEKLILYIFAFVTDPIALCLEFSIWINSKCQWLFCWHGNIRLNGIWIWIWLIDQRSHHILMFSIFQRTKQQFH